MISIRIISTGSTEGRPSAGYNAVQVLRKPTINRERRRSYAPDDQRVPPHRGRTHKTEDPDRCSDVPSSPVSDEKCRQKTESLFAKIFKSLLQQNLPQVDIARSV